MMKPRGAGAWWTAAILLALLALGVVWIDADPRLSPGWIAFLLAVAAIGCAVMGIRVGRGAG